MDPEVVQQFNCLQQTGNFCPSSSNGPTAMSSSTSSSTTMSSSTTSRQAATDAFFTLAGGQEHQDGSLGALSPSLVDQLALTLASGQ